ncbi:hypothetical protein [Methylocella sp.]|uniref:hypothetical protein n=1 Tax=Methylocella sp. TaxID=1978226 RepID=UPI0035B48C63
MSHSDPRVDRMFRRDVIGALGAVTAVWLLYAFVYYSMSGVFSDLGIQWLTGALALCVLLLNLAAIIAMITHYSEDRAAIYSRDLYYLDLLRAQRKGAK